MILISSNKRKIDEYKSFGFNIDILPGPDIKEVFGTMDEVIIYKALAVSKGYVVEDTVLEVDGNLMIDIRYREMELINHNGKPAKWTVSLGYNNGKHIKVYRSSKYGIIRNPSRLSEDRFGFEPFFVPTGQIIDYQYNLEELYTLGMKQNFSARYYAVAGLFYDTPVFSKLISDIKPWDGEYQT